MPLRKNKVSLSWISISCIYAVHFIYNNGYISPLDFFIYLFGCASPLLVFLTLMVIWLIVFGKCKVFKKTLVNDLCYCFMRVTCLCLLCLFQHAVD